MARAVVPLTDPKCDAAKPREKDYKLFDGKGLYLLVKPSGVKTWRMKYTKPDGRDGLATKLYARNVATGNSESVDVSESFWLHAHLHAVEESIELRTLVYVHVELAVRAKVQKLGLGIRLSLYGFEVLFDLLLVRFDELVTLCIEHGMRFCLQGCGWCVVRDFYVVQHGLDVHEALNLRVVSSLEFHFTEALSNQSLDRRGWHA